MLYTYLSEPSKEVLLRPLEGVRDLRERRMLSQQELADRAGVSLFTVQRIERGEGSVRPKTGRAIAAALGVGVEDLLGKVQAPLPDFEVERRAPDAEVIADYERIVREHRIAWRDALEALAEPWEERIASGAFDRGAVDQFFADVAALSLSVSRALSASVEESLTSRKYKAPPTRADVEEMEATAIGFAAARLLDVGDAVYAAAAEKFSASDLEQLRRKRDEARRALGRAA